MQKTGNFELNQWDMDDRIQMADFNSDNSRIDAALKEQQTALTTVAEAVAKCGNCRIYTTTYTGTGKYGESNPSSLAFPGEPLFVAIIENSMGSMMLAIQGAETTFSRATGAGFVNMTWSSNTMTWYASADSSQMNTRDCTYSVVALMAADA